MTGNVVLLGFAMGGTADLSVGRSLAALCAFASGSVVGGRMTNERHRTAAGHLLIAMYSEALLLCLAAGAALITEAMTPSARLYLVIVVTATAMGLRNAVVRRLGISDLTTTVLTLTITGLAADSVLAGGAAQGSADSVDSHNVGGSPDRHDAVAAARNVGLARRCRACGYRADRVSPFE
jgi:uncharacterized membrane protein YoaK (UPF0700 family)